MLRSSLTTCLAAAAFGLAAQPSLASAGCDFNVADLRLGATQVRFRVEVADTDAERALGLMHRESLPQFAGMLFVYDHPQSVSFWMKNTNIALDMLFFDSTGTLTHVHENAVPGDLTPIPGVGDVQFVLEINGGAARDLGVVTGAELRHPAVDPEEAVWRCEG